MIAVNDLSASLNAHNDRIEQAVARVLKSGWFILGPELSNFEAQFSEYIGTKHCVGVANGTDALEIVLRSLGIVQGQTVATVAAAGAYATKAILSIGANPHYMEIHPHHYGPSLSSVEQALDAGVDAVICTHLFGRVVPEIQRIAALCAARNVPMLEDCAQAHGAGIGSQRVGSFGDAAAFSFYPTKNLGALGDAGAVTTDSEDVASLVRELRQYGWSSKYTITVPGGRNSRMDEIQAAILSERLKTLERDNLLRVTAAQRYSENLNHSLVTVPEVSVGDGYLPYVAHLYVVECSQREALRARLRENDIMSDVHYPVPDHRQPFFGDRFDELLLPHTERLAQQVLTLPLYPGISDDQLDAVINCVNEWQI